MSKVTPMMKQYMEIKGRNKDSILFFRMGDFYEMFGDDAKTASKVLQIALTARGGAPMCGVPFHAANSYILKLISNGYRVAICEQIEDAKEAKGLVKRDVVKVISPGTVLEEAALDKKSNNYIMSVYMEKDSAAVAFADVSTGEFFVKDIILKDDFDYLIDEIEKIQPVEILIPQSWFENKKYVQGIINRLKAGTYRIFINSYDDWNFNRDASYEKLKEHFKVMNLEGYGIEDNDDVISASGALINYFYETQKTSLNHVNRIRLHSSENTLHIDSVSLKNLEIIDSQVKGADYVTLYDVLDNTETSMGSRELKKWLKMPLINSSEILSRQDAVQFFVDFADIRENARELLRDISDVERISGKLGGSSINGRDLVSLKKAIAVSAKLDELIKRDGSKQLKEKFSFRNDELEEIQTTIENAIVDEPPITVKEGGIIRPEFDAELKKIKDISKDGKAWIASLQEKERERTGISSLKVGYTSVFGYYIEITKANLKNTPEDYIRKQTLVNAERFITPDLKEYESMILGAQDKIKAIEYRIFNGIKDRLKNSIPALQDLSENLASIDCLISLSVAAVNNNYIKPDINEGDELVIEEGRHPVVEKNIGYNDFISNDCALNCSDNMLMIITGPNMAGKSTYMRTVSLIVVMAQIGSFVPAKTARLGMVDKIFTRVGAADYLARGQSTFMVEMIETANILNNATSRSLIILDEVGRGTSTFDGVSIAWAITEYIHEKIKAKTLFATHYYELTETAELLDGVTNYNIQVKEYGDKIVFLRKIIKGSTDRSYGIHVAQLAGLPEYVIDKAQKVLQSLEEANYTKEGKPKISSKGDTELVEGRNPELVEGQMGLFDVGNFSEFRAELKKLDINSMTPVDAMGKLNELIKKYS